MCGALEFEDWATSWHEWVSLVTMESPRILQNDHINSFLCRPIVSADVGVSTIVRVEWCGFLPGQWIRSMFIDLW